METKKIETQKMGDEEYFALRRLSNSDITNALYIMAGVPMPERAKGVFAIGRVVHALILEPENMKEDLNSYSEKDRDIIQRTTEAGLKNERIQQILQVGEIEKVVLWEWEGVKMKSKIDVWLQNLNHVIDIKTTSCLTQKGFDKDVEKYKYVKQLGLYAKSVEATTATIIGISKVNGRVFETFLSAEELEIGLEDSRKIVKKIVELDILEKVFEARG